MPLLSGAHVVLYSRNHEADRNLLRDVFELPHVDVGHGWLIFGLPASEVAVHPSDESGKHELHLITDDIETFVAEMQKRRIEMSPVQTQDWGLTSELTMPGGGTLGVYEPRHERPSSAKKLSPRAKKASSPKKSTKKKVVARKKKSVKRKR
jgi:hypothetical protein